MYGAVSLAAVNYIVSIVDITTLIGCSGILINDNWAISVAFCLPNKTGKKYAVLPDRNLPLLVLIERLEYPPNYSSTSDIVLMRTEEKFKSHVSVGFVRTDSCEIVSYGRINEKEDGKRKHVMDKTVYCKLPDKGNEGKLCIDLQNKADFCAGDVGGGLVCGGYLKAILLSTSTSNTECNTIIKGGKGLFSNLENRKDWLAEIANITVHSAGKPVLHSNKLKIIVFQLFFLCSINLVRSN
ncbi:complement factor D-like [Cimex lectularius]|uniref:Peptidase S1 domain-containing protein n=1 Tax=Cimex lectularius TaxID=79782 RepID=A0A8I6TG31_CIMLE|nr:complement factor D-like [Cimex lectularius]